ncbi:uncharacterized protein LOC123310053 [Coccinella septempunctata]|uniref:uncharacterized protein LOC123310053 n=1 Tax=Coccinella septempunctata TaxID=41139 RepID=UPI001D060BBD|nr:uncharacterized protein LOC123310053 [Coccinella septempunctata]
MLTIIILGSLIPFAIEAAPAPDPEIDLHGLNLDAYSWLKAAPYHTEPIFQDNPQPIFPSPILKGSFLPAHAYALAAPILKAPDVVTAPIYAPAAPVLKQPAPVYAPVEIYKAAVPVVKTIAPATSYASVTKYQISHARVMKDAGSAAPMLKKTSYDNSYGFH